jgi:hypothetical protein
MPTTIGTVLASAKGAESIMPSPPCSSSRAASVISLPRMELVVARPVNDLLILFGREPAHDVIAPRRARPRLDGALCASL